MKEPIKKIKGERKDEAGGSPEVTSDKTLCLQAWRQEGFMPLDKQAVAERALKLGRCTKAVIGAPLGYSSSFPKSIVFFRPPPPDGGDGASN